MRQLILLLALLIAAAPVRADQASDAAMLDRVAPAVLRISARNCGGEAGNRSGSAFAWDKPGQVVTALHVVAGCRDIQVLYQGASVQPATISRTLYSRDLVLLDVGAAPAVPALHVSTRPPAANDTVWLYGFGGGRTTREDRLLRITHASIVTPLLSDAVDDAARTELRAIGSPSLDTEVLRVEGNLVPGDSGAPIVDASGALVGIGSGGLQRGAIGAAWAVRARYLAELARSTERDTQAAAVTASRFALVDPTLGAEARCGGVLFRRTRTLRLDQLFASSDDQQGWAYLAAMTGERFESFADLTFDLWTDADTGAAFAVPHEMRVAAAPDGCRATGPVPEVEMFVAAVRYGTRYNDRPSIFQAGSLAANQFERLWQPQFLPFLQLDGRSTYPQALPSGSGIVRRLGWGGQRPDGRGHYVFEGLLAGPSSFLGVAGINRAWDPYLPMQPRVKAAWIAVSFAVHLSRVP